MQPVESIRCRVAACREDLNDGNEWSFYLINDNDLPIDSALLDQVSYEWGDLGNTEATSVRIANLASGATVLIWRDDGSGAELRMDLWLLVAIGQREVRLIFEFPKLYNQRNLKFVEGLGKLGWEVSSEA